MTLLQDELHLVLQNVHMKDRERIEILKKILIKC